jgi:hypothetical protein
MMAMSIWLVGTCAWLMLWLLLIATKLAERQASNATATPYTLFDHGNHDR